MSFNFQYIRTIYTYHICGLVRADEKCRMFQAMQYFEKTTPNRHIHSHIVLTNVTRF